MQVHEHAQTAQEFLGVSDHEFMAGDNLQASEKLWGAASHAVMAVAQQRGWRYSRHRDLKRAARKLSEETGDPTIADRFGLAEKFHSNYYHDFMEEFQINEDRVYVRDFVNRMLTLVD